MNEILEKSQYLRDTLYAADQYFTEIDHLVDALRLNVPEKCVDDSCPCGVSYQGAVSGNSENGWLFPFHTLYFEVAGPNKKLPPAGIGIQIVAYGDPLDSFYGIPVVNVSVCSWVMDPKSESNCNWYADSISSSIYEKFGLAANGRVQWGEQSGGHIDLAFSVPLLCLQGASSLDSNIYRPISRLLACIFKKFDISTLEANVFSAAIPLDIVESNGDIRYQALFDEPAAPANE